MDVVYVRSYPTRPQAVDRPPASPPSLSPPSLSPPSLAPSNVNITRASSRNTDTSNSSPVDVARDARSWRVSVRVNDADPVDTTIRDPFLEPHYKTVFERYLRHSDRPRWSAHSMTLEGSDSGGADDLADAEKMIFAYGEKLFAELGLSASSFTPGATECRVLVIEQHGHDHGASASAPGIHCLAWELLEAVHVPRLPKLRLRVTRMSDFPNTPRRGGGGGHNLRSHTRRGDDPAVLRKVAPVRSPPPLSAVQADPAAQFRVLLVVARDFSRTGAERDPEPDLAQWPLMTVQRKLRSRMLLEVVRPGSREELEDHLAVRQMQGVQFNLVHFDLHGRITADENGNHIPWLLFAKRDHISRSHGYQVPQVHQAKAESVAQLLARYQVENVVLNACLSAYNRSRSGTSLAHIFLKYGIDNVSAMWFYVHWKTVATYLDTFYDELLINCVDFHVAAQRGRDSIRQKPTNRTGREYQDFFLCVNYKRDEHRPAHVGREASPTPSARSGDSSTSNASMRSLMSGVWKPSTPRLGDSLAPESPPVMRMKLHLLELEYKLMTFRIVYASDLGRRESTLGRTMERMVDMWLGTNLVDVVLYYRAKDFAKRRLTADGPSPRDRRPRGGGYLQLLQPKRPVRALRQALHVVTDVDAVVDPGFRADEEESRRGEAVRLAAQANLQRFAERVLDEDGGPGGGGSYLLFLGHKDAQWWRTHLQHLGGDWWLHVPWSFTMHSRYIPDTPLPTPLPRPALGAE